MMQHHPAPRARFFGCMGIQERASPLCQYSWPRSYHKSSPPRHRRRSHISSAIPATTRGRRQRRSSEGFSCSCCNSIPRS
ncbi:hypothetical protein FOTG_19186 [Fusarium oxysporum f. sp. vasinfectum 25433]|uniref:Uncharacterized protein n=1 Tax=Fusarium oxysporum f. sp. vasinfectum 25433 TaxID=1089449 RepID=X0KFQ6_FUSOX|nr:hypothetical protein FOTG_19186 [Fusarium oxysporum f. sp. vasinfectum 25433]